MSICLSVCLSVCTYVRIYIYISLSLSLSLLSAFTKVSRFDAALWNSAGSFTAAGQRPSFTWILHKSPKAFDTRIFIPGSGGFWAHKGYSHVHISTIQEIGTHLSFVCVHQSFSVRCSSLELCWIFHSSRSTAKFHLDTAQVTKSF